MSDEEHFILVVIVRMMMETMDHLYEDDRYEAFLLEMVLNARKEKNRVPRIQGYVEGIVPSFTANEFQTHFRMLSETFKFLLGEIGERLQRNRLSGSRMISAQKQLLIALWSLATLDSYRFIDQRFGVEKATAIRAVARVIFALTDLAPKYILWLANERVEEIARGFSWISTFPDTIGAVDGTHINITAPKENPEAYVNCKGNHSMHLQDVCDHAGIFTHCYVGHVGSAHDARVFRLSSLQRYIRDPTKFPGNTHIIGDAA